MVLEMDGHSGNKKNKDQVRIWFAVILISLGITTNAPEVENLEN